MRPQRFGSNAVLKLPVVLLGGMLAATLIVGTPVAAFAHPLGNFTVNRYSKLTAGTQQLELLYVLDMAEIPAHAERAQIDTDGDGNLSTTEVDRYTTAAAAALLRSVVLTVDGAVAPLELQTANLSFPSGQAGLPTLRLELAREVRLLRRRFGHRGMRKRHRSKRDAGHLQRS